MMISRTLLPEWAPQTGVLLAWPDKATDWKPWLDDIQHSYVELIRRITSTTPVHLLVRNESTAREVAPFFSGCVHAVQSHIVPYDDTWIRDYGPISLLEQGALKGLDFQFNAWGQKYIASADNLVTRSILPAVAPHYIYESHPYTLEGGAIETDGEGTLLATPGTLIGDTRNKGMSAKSIEQQISLILGITTWRWLPDIKMAGDDTDGHVDTLVRFLDKHCLCYISENSMDDPNIEECKKLREWVIAWQDEDSRRTVIALPNPSPIKNSHGELLPATYANFLITNKQVIVPTYGDKNDEVALSHIARHCPDYKVSGVNARVLVEQFGSIHCATMPLFQTIKPELT